MTDWDADSPRLRENLIVVLHTIRDAARRRDVLTVETARDWHRHSMFGLVAPAAEYVGGFRGENTGRKLKQCRVTVGGIQATPPSQVARDLRTTTARPKLCVARCSKSSCTPRAFRFLRSVRLDFRSLATLCRGLSKPFGRV